MPTTPLASESNKAMQWCLDTSSDYNQAASCHADFRQKANEIKRAELRDFLKHNPRYRVPGQSLNRCWGKPRVMPFESSYIKVGPNGMEAGVNDKDKLTAGYYENELWEKRHRRDE